MCAVSSGASFVYDGAGSLVTSTLYNQLGAITEINLGNGVKTTYGYYGTGGASFLPHFAECQYV